MSSRRHRTQRASRRAEEAGYAAILVSILVPTVFLGLAALAVDTARWYLEMEKVQKAADAAALAGVPFLPQDLGSARTRALEVAERNGYDIGDAEVDITVGTGTVDTQLRVTISTDITNQFGAMIGVPGATIIRTAVADYNGPAPMGSPCNVFGTEPPSGSASAASPVGTAIGSSRPPNCKQDPEMWANVEGPQTGKVQGDRYGTRSCETSGVDGCDGSQVNQEYNEDGYFWLVKVEPAMVNQPISLQLFDPAFVRTGQFCDESGVPNYSDLAAYPSPLNPYVGADHPARYGETDRSDYVDPPVPFCTGDSFPGSGGTNPMTTTFVLRQQTDTNDPMAAPVQAATSGTPCVRQYGARTSNPSIGSLRSASSSYEEDLARVFHNWTELCSFRPTRAGDYYLQVRTNKRYNFSSGQLIRSITDWSTANTLANTGGDSSLYGAGSNAFGVRAVTPSGLERSVAVSGWDRMPIYANSPAAQTEFNLIRVLPGAAGQFISFDFFDAGDAAGTGSVQVMLPTDAESTDGGPITDPFPGPGCTSEGGSAGSGQNLVNCTATLTQNGSGVSRNNGKVQTINIPIPSDYTCDATELINCWYRVKVTFASGEVHDVTTWDAEIVGDPVRLVE